MDYLNSNVFKQYLDSDSVNEIERKEVFEKSEDEVKVFNNIARVNAKELKTVLSDVEAILKKSTMGSAVAFQIKENKLIVRCMNKVFYKAMLDMQSDCEDCEIVTVYKPVSKTIPDEGMVDVTLNPGGVELKTLISEITLLPNIASVINVEVENYGFTSFNSNIVLSSLKSLLSTTSIINKIGGGVNVSMQGKYMSCKYHTVYLECPCDKVRNNITHEMGRILFNFLNSEGTCFLSQGVNNQIFKKSTRYLALPVNDSQVPSIREILKDAEYFGNVHHRGLYENVKQLVQSFGPGVGKVDLYKEGTTVTRETEGCRIRVDSGSKEEYLFSITVNLDFLRDVLNLAGNSYKLYKKGDYACLETVEGYILII